jgi:protein TonB
MAIHGAPPPSPEVTAFSEHAKQELLATADGEVVRQALFILHSSGSPAVPQGSRSAEVNDFTRTLADRAEKDFGIKAAVPTMPGATSTASDPKQIRVGPTVQAAKLLKKADPVYPPLAQQARIQGTVRFNAVIGTDGRMKTLTLVSGHPLMVGPAQDAAQQYEYQPTLLNGVAVEVVTTVDVDFRLAQ